MVLHVYSHPHAKAIPYMRLFAIQCSAVRFNIRDVLSCVLLARTGWPELATTLIDPQGRRSLEEHVDDRVHGPETCDRFHKFLS